MIIKKIKFRLKIMTIYNVIISLTVSIYYITDFDKRPNEFSQKINFARGNWTPF